MGNYRSAYEEYYKNINKKTNDKEHSKYLPLDKNIDVSLRNKETEKKYFTKRYWIKRFEREIAGALILVTLFAGLKYIKINEVQKIHIICKQSLMQNFDYDSSIEAFNNVEIGTFKIRDAKIGDFKVEDLKFENLKLKMNNFINYIRNQSSTQI